MGTESFSGAVEFAADRVSGLIRQLGDFLITEFFIRHQKDQESVFLSQEIQRLLNPFTEFFVLQGMVGTVTGIFRARYLIG